VAAAERREGGNRWYNDSKAGVMRLAIWLVDVAKECRSRRRDSAGNGPSI